MSWLVQVVDDGRRIAARGRVSGVIECRIEPGITGHAGASRLVEDRRTARRRDRARRDATIRSDPDANANASLDFVTHRARRILFLDSSRPAGQTVRGGATSL